MSQGFVGYSLVSSMRTLLACPFCREMFDATEAKKCPDCGLALKRLEDLPKAKVIGGEVEEVSPDEETLPWTYLGRARGALVAVGAAGIGAFLLPWSHEIAPENQDLTGPMIASHLGWMWAPLVAWMVMIPLVLSRRNVFRMRGARVAVGFLGGVTLMTVLVRLVFKPASSSSALDPHFSEHAIGVYLSGALSLAAIALSFVFGGRIDVLSTKKANLASQETLH